MDTDDQLANKLRDIAAKTSEQFDDYLIIVKPRKGEMFCKTSDVIWSIGAANQFLAMQEPVNSALDPDVEK